jgi:hypothetical protein
VSGYRIVWSLEKALMGKTGRMDSELDPVNSQDVMRCDHRNGLYAQVERDPYICEYNELGFAVKKPRRRGAA